MAKLGTQSVRGVPQVDENPLRLCLYDPTVDRSGQTASPHFPPQQKHRGGGQLPQPAEPRLKGNQHAVALQKEKKRSRAGRVAERLWVERREKPHRSSVLLLSLSSRGQTRRTSIWLSLSSWNIDLKFPLRHKKRKRAKVRVPT